MYDPYLSHKVDDRSWFLGSESTLLTEKTNTNRLSVHIEKDYVYLPKEPLALDDKLTKCQHVEYSYKFFDSLQLYN